MLYYINDHWDSLPVELTGELYLVMDRAVGRHHSMRRQMDAPGASSYKSTMLAVTESAEVRE